MRIKKIQDTLSEKELDALIISREPNIYYYTKSISGGFLIIPLEDIPTLFISELNVAHHLVRYEDKAGQIITCYVTTRRESGSCRIPGLTASSLQAALHTSGLNY